MKAKILLVEDDESVHGALSEVLHGEGYEVLHAFDGDEALQAIQVHADLGLVLLDLNLSGKNGWDTFEGLTARNHMLPVIIITARSDQHVLADAAGVGALMEKPLNIPVLLQMIERLLARQPMERLARLVGKTPCSLYPFSGKNGSNRNERSAPERD